jgi:hypothetical protein
MKEIDRLEEAIAECRDLIRDAHAATKDLRTALREYKEEVQSFASEQLSATLEGEVARQLEELGKRTQEAIGTATDKVIDEFDRFGESLLGKQAYWEKVSGRRAAKRPDPDVLSMSPPDEGRSGATRGAGAARRS